MSAVWGYIRVSSKDQNEARQVEEIRPLVTTESHMIVEKMSGKDFNRPKYQAMKNLVQAGDSVVIKSLDRLGRNYQDIKKEWAYFKEKEVHVRVLDMPLLNTDNNPNDLTMNLISDVVLELLSYVAESERRNIKQRQAEGIKLCLAKEDNNYGRPKVKKPDNWDEVISKLNKKEITAVEAMKTLDLKKTTFYSLLKSE